MPSIKQKTQLIAAAMRSYAALAVLYVVLLFLLPVDKQAINGYNLSTDEYRSLLFVVTLPLFAVWCIAFYSYAKLQEYAQAIHGTPESSEFRRLATGATWLAWSLPLPALVFLMLGSIASTHPGFRGASTIISNELRLVMPLVAFSIIGLASRSLLNRARLGLSSSRIRSIMLVFIATGVLYCYLIFRNLGQVTLSSNHNPYYLPIWLVVLLIIIPYLYTWFIGLLASYEMYDYSQHAKGLLYRQALQLLAGGLVTVILSSIALQYLVTVEPHARRLILDYHLVLTTLFQLLGGLGFLLIAVGAKKLKKIEEV